MVKFPKDMPGTNASKLYQHYYALLSHLFPPEQGHFIFPPYKSTTQFRAVNHRTASTVTFKTDHSVVFLL